MARARPLLLLAHGAGAPSSSPWMKRWAARLEALGRVVPFDYPYMTAGGRRAPDRLPRLIEAHRAALAAARRKRERVVLVGKSMGSRVGCHLAVEDPASAAAIVCFGYPLVGASGAVRDEVLLALERPILFIQGDRDTLCPLDQLEAVRRRMRAPSQLLIVAGGDHSLELSATARRARSVDQETVERQILDDIATFLDRSINKEPRPSGSGSS